MMKKASAAILLAMAALASPAQTVPPLVNYQARLTGSSGAPLAPGPYLLQFRLWNDPTAKAPANLLWSQQQTLTVQSNGTFGVILGASAGASIPGDAPAVTNLASAFASAGVFLGITIAAGNGVPVPSPSEILPRQQLLSVPFAVQAQQAQQAQVASSLAPNLSAGLCPPGSIMPYMGTSAPPGWLLCDGSLVGRTLYPALFGVVGAASGPGDGATTFNLPDLRGMFLRGVSGSQSNTNYLDPDAASRTSLYAGGNTGNAVGSVQTDMFASHTHTYSGGGSQLNPGNPAAAGSGYPSRDVPVSAAGGNETRPKNVYVNYIIKY